MKIVDSSESKSKSDCSNGYSNLLWCVDSGCSKHMIGNLKLLINFIWKFMGTVRFENDHVAAILGFEVAFRRNGCFVKNLEGVDLLKGDCSTNLYIINLHEMASALPICLMARASSTKSWLWHQRLSHLNFDIINDLARNDIVVASDEELEAPIEDQLLPTDASPTALLPGYIDDSNLEEDPEEDPVDYPANGGDNDDNESSDDDDDDDDVEKDEEEEHLAPIDPSVVPIDDHKTMTTVNQGMRVEEIKRVVAQRVANAIEAIAIYETKTNLARKSMSHTERQKEKVEENASNKRNWDGVDENIIDEHYHKFVQVWFAHTVHEKHEHSRWFDSSCISEGANLYGAWATGDVPGTNSIWNSTWLTRGRPGSSSRKTSRNSLTT
nr:hypothetical protein [Tanacetum cinerariifolium]GEZ33528.1 hypothetical protein [Tanacetum cinerariifolium]